MPVIQPGDLVLITGASGFIAAHTVLTFLNAGFRVRGTVRSPAKGEYLKALFKEKASSFEYCIVDDISKPGAFDEAVKGVDAVAHTASPFHTHADELDELFVPAVQGTIGILESLKKHCPSVKRVVVTSSNAAVTDPARASSPTGPVIFTEKDWNETSVETCKSLGREAPAVEKYRASKVLAEKAFWAFFKDHKPQFDGVALNPPMVYGPPIHECKSADQLNTSCNAFYQWQLGKKSGDDLKTGGSWVDVRDCAIAHVRALTVPEASMQRFIVSGGSYCGDDICLVLNKLYPSSTTIPTGDPTAHDIMLRSGSHIDGTKAKEVLGIEYTSFDKCFNDMAAVLESRFGM